MNREQLLDECKRTVTKHRQDMHGRPEDSFGRIAAFWSAYLGGTVTPADVAAMMILLKVARIRNKAANEDNWLDAAGYAACGCEVATARPAPSEQDAFDEPSDAVRMQRLVETAKQMARDMRRRKDAGDGDVRPVVSDPDRE